MDETRVGNEIEPLAGLHGGLALVLSGGAVRGTAHVGVLEVLEEEGIEPDLVVGTSAGAVVGSAWAGGLRAAEIGEVLAATKWSEVARIRLKRTMSLFDTEPMERFLEDRFELSTFEELDLRFAAVATDLTTGERVVLCSGMVATAVRASAAVPGLFAPVELEGRLLADGGLIEYLPIATARELGAAHVIAVDLHPPGETRRPSNVFEVLLTALTLRREFPYRAVEPADVIVRPDIGDTLGLDFDKVPEFIAAGRAAAEEALDQLRALPAAQP